MRRVCIVATGLRDLTTTMTMKREGLRVKWEELKLEVEQRVKVEGLKGEEAKESRGLVSLRSVTKEAEPTTTEGLWLTGRGIEEWLDRQLDTEVDMMSKMCMHWLK